MRNHLIKFIFIFASTIGWAQKTDTIKFYSKAFNSEREVYISTPEFYKYQSEKVNLPVIYILDAQHEWFIKPALNTIQYLQYTHQIPQAIIVQIPLLNRNKECGIRSLEGKNMPLHTFITEDITPYLTTYQPNQYKMLIGHSFSASFALYSYLKSSKFYSAVIAHTPLDSFRELIIALENDSTINKKNIYISVGGKENYEDFYHRKAFDKLKVEFPDFFNKITTFIAEKAGHTAVPILANPYLLTQVFADFNNRYGEIAIVNDEYILIEKPLSVIKEIDKIDKASKIGSFYYAPEIAELNGLISRYVNSEYYHHGIALNEKAIALYPLCYDFYYQLYELYLPNNKSKAKVYLDKSLELLQTIEPNSVEKTEAINELKEEYIKNGW